MSTLHRILGILILLTIVSACTDLAGEVDIVSTLPPRPTIDNSNPEELGAAVFAARCASCHGETGLGNGAVAIEADLNMPNFTLASTSADQSLNQWTNTIRFGRIENIMPPWGNSLSEEEIEAVAAYTFTIWQDFPQDVAVANATQVAPTSAVASPTVPFIEESIGTITGEVIQGTANAILPDVISVALHVLDAEGNESNFEMQVLQDGMTYNFEDILIRHDYTYFLTAIYQGVVFYSEIVFGTPESPDLTLPVEIYEATSDESAIEIDLFLLRLMPSGDEIVIQQLINFSNTTDRVYRGDNQIDGFTYDSVRIPIPNGATIINSVDLVPRFLMLEGEGQQTILDTQPVLPNSDHLVEVVYTLPFSLDDSRLNIELPTRYNLIQPVEVMVQPGRYTIQSDDFTSSGTQHFSVGVFESFLSEPMTAGSLITFDVLPAIDDNHEAQSISQRRNLVSILALSGMSLIVISAIALFLKQTSD